MSKSAIAYTDDVKVWQRLAKAIIKRAVDDYRSWPERMKRCKPENLEALKGEFESLRSFFLGRWFSTLCDLEGQEVLERLDNEVHE